MTADLICLGEPLLEFNPLERGPLHAARTFRVGYGGDTSNVAVAARRSGASVAYATRLGDDPFGDTLVDMWTSEGIDTSLVEREAGGTTGIYFISRDPEHSAFTYYRTGSAASRMTAQGVPASAIRDARALHVSGITQAISTSACDSAFRAVEEARASGTLVSYDPNHRPLLWATERARAVIVRSLQLADLALPNLAEGRMLSGAEQPEDVLAWLAGLGPRTVVLKLGAEGALLWHDGDVVRVPAPPVEPVDSTGAGDTFDGAFLAQLLRGTSAPEAARYAAQAAALSTQGIGAVEPIPRHDVVVEALDAGGHHTADLTTTTEEH